MTNKEWQPLLGTRNLVDGLKRIPKLAACTIEVDDLDDVWIRSADYIAVFAPIDEACQFTAYRVFKRGRDFQRADGHIYYVHLVRMQRGKGAK